MNTVDKIQDNLFLGKMPTNIEPYQFVICVGEKPTYPIPVGKIVVVSPLLDGYRLPDEQQLHRLAYMVNSFTEHGPTLVHCSMGFNRSALVVGLALINRGMIGRDVVSLIREVRGTRALQNDTFCEWLSNYQ